jgi:hypothetical protein
MKKVGRPKKIGRRPVIAVRVREPLYNRIVEAARVSGRSMSDEMAVLLERGFELTDSHGNRKQQFQERSDVVP